MNIKQINRQIDENMSITDRTSPVSINIPLISKRPEQNSINCKNGVKPNTKLRKTMDEIRSIVPRTFSANVPMNNVH